MKNGHAFSRCLSLNTPRNRINKKIVKYLFFSLSGHFTLDHLSLYFLFAESDAHKPVAKQMASESKGHFLMTKRSLFVLPLAISTTQTKVTVTSSDALTSKAMKLCFTDY